MSSAAVYTIEIVLERRSGARAGVFNVVAIDRSRQRVFEAGVADLGLKGKAVALPSGRPLLAEEFLGRFRRGAPANAEQGIAFGRMLLGFLLGDSRVARAWNEMQSRRMASGLPMRLLLRLPHASPSAQDAAAESPNPANDVGAIPFELLADEHGFLFKDRGHSLVRLIEPSQTEVERTEGPAETQRAGVAAPEYVLGTRPRAAKPPLAASAGGAPRELAWVSPVTEIATPTPLASLEETVRAWSLEGSAAAGTLIGDRAAAPLPEPSPYFRGRSALVQEVLTVLARERLVSIVGMAGSGKTDLAAAVAHRALFDGDLELESAGWFSLDGLTEVDALRIRIALSLGLDPRRCHSDEQLAKGIGEGRALFVLDGAEVLLGDPLTRTRLQWLLNTLLTERRELRFLVVTRARIGEMAPSSGDVAAAREVVVSVEPLESPSDREIFIAAAGARLPPEEHRSAAVAELLTELRGHHRALLLAAAVSGSRMGPLDVREQLVDRGSDADEIDARARVGIAIKPGSADVERADRYVRCLRLVRDALAATDERALEVLVWLGLLPSGLPEVLFPHVFGAGAERLGALLLMEGVAERRDVDRCIGLVAPLECFGLSPWDVIPERRRAELVEATLRAIAAWLSTSGAQAGISGAGIDRDRAVQQESNLASLVLAVPEAAPREWAQRVSSAVAAAIVPFVQQMIRAGRARAASVVCREAVRRIAPLGVRAPLAAVLSLLGDLLARLGRLPEAQQVYEQALPLYRALFDAVGEASTLQALGEVSARAGRAAEAQRAFERALPLFRSLDDRLGEATALGALGDIFLKTDRLAEAEDAYELALPMYRSLGERLSEARTLQALGDVLRRTNRLKEAEDAYARALPIYRVLDESLGEATTMESLGKLALAEALVGHQRDRGAGFEDAAGDAAGAGSVIDRPARKA